MRRFTTLGILFAALVSCGEPGQDLDEDQAKKTADLLAEADRQVGMPNMVNWQERKLMKMIFELRDRSDLICYAYLYDRNSGSVGEYLGRCLGYGLPYSVQFTNPERVAIDGPNGKTLSLPQADPNGLFMPTGLSATWLMLLDEEGEPRPVYVEPEIIVSPFALHE